MAKFYGKIGYVTSKQVSPGVFEDDVVERTYRGDILQNSRRWETTDNLNDNLVIANQISIIGDIFAYANLETIKYVIWQGVMNGFHPRRSGDVLIIQDPGWAWTTSTTSTNHNAPWAYDTHVPLLLWGPGIQGGCFHRRVTTMDIAPTLSQVLGIGYPSGSLGSPLYEALDRPLPTVPRSCDQR